MIRIMNIGHKGDNRNAPNDETPAGHHGRDESRYIKTSREEIREFREEMKANQEQMKAETKTQIGCLASRMEVNQEETKARQDKMEAAIKNGEEKIEATPS
jgi:predicted phage tail protein